VDDATDYPLLTVVWRGAGPGVGAVAGSAVSRRRGLAFFYLWLFRGTPVLFQIIFVYNVLPGFGLRFSAFTCAVLALSLNEGAYMAEILRSGLQAVKAASAPPAWRSG
jgi:His/Glu/Gln/Arg/opine family amino acid ABC transporter permease subunit